MPLEREPTKRRWSTVISIAAAVAAGMVILAVAATVLVVHFATRQYVDLCEAARVDDMLAVRCFLLKGADVNAEEKPARVRIAGGTAGGTALHAAALNGRKRIAEVLIAAGANVDARDRYMRTPLHYAAERGRADIAEVLIANGADVNARGDRGETPLLTAGVLRHHDVADLLRKHGAKE